MTTTVQRGTIALCAAFGITACGTQFGSSSVPATATKPGAVAASLKYKVWTAGQTPGFPASAVAADVAPDSNGNVWFTDYGTPAIGRIASDGTVTEFTKGLQAGAIPLAIVPGRNGDMWFSDYRGVAVGRITQSGAITEFTASQYSDTRATGLTVDARGRPWLTGAGIPPVLGHLAHGKMLAARLLPQYLTPGPALVGDANGTLWFAAVNKQLRGQIFELDGSHHRLTRIDMHLHYSEVPCCPNQAPRTMVIGPDGNPWFTTLFYGHKLSPAQFLGSVKNGRVGLERIGHAGLTHIAYASGIAAGATELWLSGSDPFAADGALWRIDSHGKQTTYDVPYSPFGLDVDGSEHPWFTSLWSGHPSQIVEVLQ